MHGNLFEWVDDWYADSGKAAWMIPPAPHLAT